MQHGTLFQTVQDAMYNLLRLPNLLLVTHRRKLLLNMNHSGRPLKRRFAKEREQNSCSLR